MTADLSGSAVGKASVLPSKPLTWRTARSLLQPQQLGENLTVEGVNETAVRVGDVLRAGTAEFMVTQPRLPCYKLNIRFQRPDMVKRFLRSGRTGFYLAVIKEGELAAGDEIELVPTDLSAVTIPEVVSLYTSSKGDSALRQRAIATPALPQSWREYFQRSRPERGLSS